MDYTFTNKSPRTITIALLMLILLSVFIYHGTNSIGKTNSTVDFIPKPANVGKTQQKQHTATSDQIQQSCQSEKDKPKVTIGTSSSFSSSASSTQGTTPSTYKFPNTTSSVHLTSTEMTTMKKHHDIHTIEKILNLSDGVFESRSHLFSERRNMVRENCQRLGKKQQRFYAGSLKYLVEVQHKIIYCPIPKVSSTFWKKILRIMSSRKCDSAECHDINVRSKNKLRSLGKLSKQKLRIMLKTGSSLLFIRDPYARLFSGYENKIYHTNLVFWKAIGAKIVKTIRGYNNSQYGFDVTFAEFIKYILYLKDSGQRINNHFQPMTEICDPCRHNFDLIGKLETIKDDYKYIMEYLTRKYSGINVNISDITRDSASSSVKGRVRFLYQVKKRNSTFILIPFKQLMLRTWRDFQMRGIISKHIRFPYENYTETEVDNVTNTTYLEQLLNALDQSASLPGLSSQRDEALIQAYRTISLEDMERLRKYVKSDCQILGYDDRPEKLFDRSSPVDISFDYLAGL